MKLNKIFTFIAAAVTLLVACDQKEPDNTPVTPNIRISPMEVTVPVAGGSATASLTANLDWTVSGAPSWLTVSPESGEGSLYKQTITVTAQANTAGSREGVLTFEIEGGSVELKVKQQNAFGPDAPEKAIYFEAFKEGAGNFAINDVKLTGPLTRVWMHDSNYACMKASAYIDGSAHESESWLVSPEVDLTSVTEAYFTFEHAGQYFGDITKEATAWISKDGGDWTPLVIEEDNYPTNWAFVTAGNWDLAEYLGSKVKFGFKFISSDAKSGTWEVRNVAVVAGAFVDDTLPAVDPTKTSWMELPAMDNSELKYFSHRFMMDDMEYRNYTVAWSQKDLVSVWVAYPLCSTYTKQNVDRTDAWAYDPHLGKELSSAPFSYYAGDYDRGHQLPSADRLCCAKANKQTFYGTNIVPQMGEHNTGVWGDLEKHIRNNIANPSDTTYVVTGCVVDGATEVSTDSDGKTITIPVAFFKAVLRYQKGADSEWTSAAFYTKHEGTGGEDIKSIAMSVDQLEEKLGLDFFVNLEGKIGKDQAAAVESQDPSGLL